MRHATRLLLLALIALLSGCASWLPGWARPGTAVAVGTPPAISASGVPPGSPQPGGPPPSSLQTFAAVLRDTQKTEGLFTTHRREERVWLELQPEDFGKPFFLAPKVTTGIGEAWLFGGLFEDARLIEFRRIQNQVQMLVRNARYQAPAGTPEARALAAAFSPSLLASAAVVSQPHPTSKAVLVDLNSLFLNDMLGRAVDLQRTYRQGYGFDPRNSAITAVRGKPDSVVIEVLAHYATGSIVAPQFGAPPGSPVPTVPRSVPDPRSLFMTLQYALTRLPEQPMAARRPDPRIGHFTSTLQDFGSDTARSSTVRQINRWRLVKKDPAAAMSEPVKPIVYWLDRSIPLQYRDTIRAGILEWNKAFEMIGFTNAIAVKVQPDDADFDTFDPGLAAVRWMSNSGPSFVAIGMSHVDPRSGEILASNIAIEAFAARARRAQRAQVLPPNTIDWRRLLQAAAEPGDTPAHDHLDPNRCEYADLAGQQLAYGLDVLAARGELAPEGPEAQQFVLDFLKETTMHEVGHTLGLRHNFRASRVYSDHQLSDPEYTRSRPLAGSVMDYAPINLAAPGAAPVAPFQATLGPYDLWAIEYAYKPIAAADEKAELARIAARSSEPELAYATDEDNFLGIDPDALQYDLGSDAIAFARKRLAIARDLFKRQESRALPPDEDYATLRRSLDFAVADAATAVGVLSRQIGGVRTLRDYPGSGRDPLQPVPALVQREALDVMSRSLFAADSLVVSPALQRRLAPDFQERGEALYGGEGSVATDFSLTQRVLGLQRALLGQLMSDSVAARIIDSQGKAAQRGEAFQLSELYGRLEHDIWSELGGLGDIGAPRRELQREYINRVSAMLLRPSPSGRADARSLLRSKAQALLPRVRGASQRSGLSADARAHLQDCADTLSQALSARLLRSGL
ncbi:MAG: zinc-dependent metalloprotease [Burkholderiaceae bacterium]